MEKFRTCDEYRDYGEIDKEGSYAIGETKSILERQMEKIKRRREELGVAVAFYSGKLSNCNIERMFERCAEN